MELAFRGEAYAVGARAGRGETLSVEAEHGATGERWRGDFTAQYVEAITAKTGCAKKYATFVRILMSALRQESTSAFIDLLTYRDLEAMKQSRDPRGGKLRAAEEVHSKRYLIVTYSTEHERAHFPLPLLAEDRPPAAGGGRRAQAPRSKRPAQPAAASPRASPRAASAKEEQLVETLKHERMLLRSKVKELEKANARALDLHADRAAAEVKELKKELKMGKKEREVLRARAEAAEGELVRARNAHKRELKRKQRDISVLQQEHAKSKDIIKELRGKNRDLNSEVKKLQRQGRTPLPRSTPRSTPRGPTPRGSRGPSPAGSRRSTPRSSLYSTPVSSRGASPAGSRPGSARGSGRIGRSPSPRPRFDPTAYVQQQREKQADIERRRGRSRGGTPSPRRTPRTSGASTPVGGSRSSSREKRAASKEPTPRASRREAAPKKWAEEQEVERISQQVVSRRVESPGRALRDVQAKLNEDANKQASKEQAKASTGRNENAQAGLYDETSAEIADIDARLNALQSFLRNVKVHNGPEPAVTAAR